MMIQNAIYIPEDDFYLNSVHRHDFVKYTARDDKELYLDGGLDYRRVGGDFGLIKYVDYILRDTDPFELIVERKLWGTRGKDGKKPLLYRPLRTFSPSHLLAIRQNCPYAAKIVQKVVAHLLKLPDLTN